MLMWCDHVLSVRMNEWMKIFTDYEVEDVTARDR